MEDVLDTYAAPPEPCRPLVCFDEAGKELRAEVRASQPMTAHHPRRDDPEYQRQGSANLFLTVAPHLGWRRVAVTERRTHVDFAHAMRTLVDIDFPDADCIIVVLDNLNTHTKAALYATFPAEEAHRIARRLEFHYTPKHGSWLNIAELELSALARQCLDRRIPDPTALAQETTAWANERNAARLPVQWRFTCADARRTLTRLYPHPEADNEP